MNHVAADIERLHALRRRVRWELETLGYPARPWVKPVRGVHQVIIVGAGQTGLTVFFALKRAMVEDVLIRDALPEGGSAGLDRLCPHAKPAHAQARARAEAGGAPALSSRLV